jgi:hypothetical protein
LELEGLASLEGYRHCWHTGNDKVSIARQRDVGDGEGNICRAGDGFRRGRSVEVRGTQVDRGCAVEREVDGRAETIQETVVSTKIDAGVSEDWSRKLGNTRYIELIDLS